MAESSDEPQGYYDLEKVSELVQLSGRRVQQLVNEGYIPKPRKAKYHLVGVVRGVIRYWRDRAQGGGGESGEKYAHHRARLLQARANIAEMEEAKLRAELIPAGEIQPAWEAMALHVRNHLLAVPTKVTAHVPQSVRAQVFQLLTDAIHQALTELSETEIIAVPPKTESVEAAAS
jgi:phage terminase Nu1 subunit (DNA packaging protein)